MNLWRRLLAFTVPSPNQPFHPPTSPPGPGSGGFLPASWPLDKLISGTFGFPGVYGEAYLHEIEASQLRVPFPSPGKPMATSVRVLALLLAVSALCSEAVSAQQMPKEGYYRFLPMSYTRPVRQSAASEALNLFGDAQNPGYVDSAPRDGIDDARGQNLHNLALRFAPYLVLNTTEIPMDWKRFWNHSMTWPLHVDVWNTAAEGGELLREETIDFLALGESSCPRSPPGSPREDSDDCRLLSLLEEFDPELPRSDYYRTAAVDRLRNELKVIYWNFPGYDEGSWKDEYEDQITNLLPRRYEGYAKTYMHPFIEKVATARDGHLGYELVLQFWFFYPTNDGANNHEGDWEHVNIVVSPKNGVTRPQSALEIQRMLDGQGLSDSGEDMLVIKRVDYYFHERVWTLDYARPNVYQPREAWEREIAGLGRERVSEERIWKALRERAYEDAAETVPNTHIIGFIGSDSKGNDMLLAAPGGKNRDSHGTYPFQGLYKDVGPAGTSESIDQRFDYREFLDSDRPGLMDGPFGRGSVVRFDREDRIEIWPDWERIHDLLYLEPEVRREWSWMVLPLRWGYPATSSLFAGIVAHANTGNLAPQGPPQNKGWNLGRAGSGFHDYYPHQFSGYFALGWQDTFDNNWGFLNATLPTLTILPPFDIAYRILGAPIALLTKQPPTFFDAARVPFRFAGLSIGYVAQDMDEGFMDLFLNEGQLPEIVDRLTDGGPIEEASFFDTGTSIDPLQGISGGISFFVGRRFVSENALAFISGDLGQDLADRQDASVHTMSGRIGMIDYSGSLRWNFLTGSLQPFAKLGYGWAWYGLKDVEVDGLRLSQPDSDTISTFVWHWGLGLEWLPILSYAPPPRGIDVGVRIDFSTFNHALGLDQISDPLTLALGNTKGSTSVVRPSVLLALTVGF